MIFTALEGTLLEPSTLEAGPSRSILERLHAAGVPVVPVTVMTLEEVEPIARELGLRHAMIIEAGGAIARFVDGAWDVEPCGPDPDTLLDVVREIEEISGADLLVYSALPDDEAARLSGRSGEMLARSMHRRFSEPFVVEGGSITAVVKAAASIGFSVRRGRRFFYLCRACDEGEAFSRLREELRCEAAIALGGSPLDAEFLTRAEVPIVVPERNGEPDAELLAKVPNARIAPAPGPAGWGGAIEEVWPAVTAGKRRTRRA